VPILDGLFGLRRRITDGFELGQRDCQDTPRASAWEKPAPVHNNMHTNLKTQPYPYARLAGRGPDANNVKVALSN